MGVKVKSIIHEATAEVHSNMLKFGENEPDKVEEICTAAQTKAETLEKQLEEYIREILQTTNRKTSNRSRALGRGLSHAWPLWIMCTAS
jgi:hypothetical protein